VGFTDAAEDDSTFVAKVDMKTSPDSPVQKSPRRTAVTGGSEQCKKMKRALIQKRS